MEVVFKKYLESLIDDRLKNGFDFKRRKKIKLGSTRPGSCVWTWSPCSALTCYMVLEFYKNSDFAGVGVGWSNNEKELDFYESNRISQEALAAGKGDLNCLFHLPSTYLHMTEFGLQSQFVSSLIDLAPVERVKFAYRDPEVLKAALDSAGYTEVDWEKNTSMRYWGIMEVLSGEPLTLEDAEYATSKMSQEMLQFLDEHALPYLSRVAETFCKQ
ncbi:hypothetical protein [Chitinivorax sp. B]|uniref:hypothetical protein n=1 Tax=Chitinivorax sp. B TaxID=2502235 RepID=UPI0010F6D36D|nr:hypothetical protein [Chitinivorax sp. B]